MRNSRLDRILYIQQVLVQGGVLNNQQTADHFGVSEKTIQRDLDTLRNHFADGEPRREILYNSAKGGYLLDDTLSRFLTSSEILAVCKILLESRSMVKEEMFPILDKLILACTPMDRLNQVKISSVMNGSIMSNRSMDGNSSRACGRLEQRWKTTTSWRSPTAAPTTARPVCAPLNRWASCSASIISIWRRSLRASTRISTSRTRRTTPRRFTASTASKAIRPSNGTLPSGILTAFRRARCASASSLCMAASCRPSGLSIPGQAWNPCLTACQQQRFYR